MKMVSVLLIIMLTGCSFNTFVSDDDDVRSVVKSFKCLKIKNSKCLCVGGRTQVEWVISVGHGFSFVTNCRDLDTRFTIIQP